MTGVSRREEQAREQSGRRTKSEVLEVLAGSEELPVAHSTVTRNHRVFSESEPEHKCQ
jgi:hypothetical protein